MPESTPKKDRDALIALVTEARELACGGCHANASDPFLPPDHLAILLLAATYLNHALAALTDSQTPDFEVFEGAAGMLTRPAREVAATSENP